MPGHEAFENVDMLPPTPEVAEPVDPKLQEDVAKALQVKLQNLQLPQ